MKRLKVLISGLISFLLILSSSANTVNGETASQSGFIDSKEYEQYISSLMDSKLREYNIQDAIFITVKDGKVFNKKSFGGFDADKTVLPLTNTSELFTATAIMQLSEQNKLNLGDDVNKYLKDFKIKNIQNKPVTINNLLTHTSGFDGTSFPVSLNSLSSGNMPALLQLPGQLALHNDYDKVLLEYLVSKVSGVPYESYILNNIFKPLNMTNSNFILEPETQLNSTVSDISKFMLAHLQNGSLGTISILKDSTAKDMHKQHFTNYTGFPGYAYGFYENENSNQRELLNYSYAKDFSSLLSLIPDKNIGFFIAAKGKNANIFADDSKNSIVQTYFKEKSKPESETKTVFSKNNIKSFYGTYRDANSAHSGFDKILLLNPANLQINISIKNEAALNIDSKNYNQVRPLLFRAPDQPDIAFKANKEGIVQYMFVYNKPWIVWEKVKWYENRTLHYIVIAAFSLIFLLTIIAGIIRLVLPKQKNGYRKSVPTFNIESILAMLTSILNIIFIFGFYFGVFKYIQNKSAIPNLSNYLFTIPIITALFALVLVLLHSKVWRTRNYPIIQKLYYSLIAFASLGFTIFLYFWNLLRIPFKL